MGRLDGRVAIVTGAGQGIGRGIALVFAREGARVVIGEIKEHRARRTADEIVAAGGEAFAVATDVADRDEVGRLVDEAVERYGSVDILVNNAQAMHARTPVADLTAEQIDVFLLSGLKGTLWAMQAVYPIMKEKAYGRIINFVSSAGIKGEPGLADYNATKEGIRALTKTAAREWGGNGITVNCIAPGAASQRGLDFAQRDPDAFARRNAEKAIPRLGDPETDIAPVALFLAGEESRFVTGQTIFADGGDCLL
jgi:NAD(P)-dependent dehydrogenase (short-subunit alcohol dehydrogenase family)